MKKDNLVAGGIAGLIGSFVTDILGMIWKWSGLADRAFYNFSTVIIANQVYEDKGFLGYLMSIISQAAVGVMFGVPFAYMIKFSSSRYQYIKGLGYGFVLWFILHGFGTIFNLPLFTDIPINVSYTTLLTSLAYGIVLAWVLHRIDKHLESDF